MAVDHYSPVGRTLASPAVLSSSLRPPRARRLQVSAARPENVTLTGREPAGRILRIGLDTTQADAESIVGILNRLAQVFARLSFIREFTVREVICSNVNNDTAAHLRSITRFVMEQMVFVRDPVGSEYVISPVNLIAQINRGEKGRGDCDDHCLLLASMLGSVGFPVKIIGVKLNGSILFNHVIVSVFHDGEWRDVDPCAKETVAPDYAERLWPAD